MVYDTNTFPAWCTIRIMWLVHCLEDWSAVNIPDSKVHGANMGPIWGRQDPGGPYVGPMNMLFGMVSLMRKPLLMIWTNGIAISTAISHAKGTVSIHQGDSRWLNIRVSHHFCAVEITFTEWYGINIRTSFLWHKPCSIWYFIDMFECYFKGYISESLAIHMHSCLLSAVFMYIYILWVLQRRI